MEAQKPKLNHIEEFRQVLADYHMSGSALSLLDEMRFVVFTGIAGGGRNTVINELVAQEPERYAFVVSTTTRLPKVRNGELEQHGVQYYFESEDEVLEAIRNGEFLEAEVIHEQQVSGISIKELRRIHESGRVAIADCEFGGANNIHANKPDADIIGLVPKSDEVWIGRLTSREATISDEEIARRTRTAAKVLRNILESPHIKVVINDDLQTCVHDVRDIVENDTYPPEVDRERREVVKKLYEDIQKRLAA